ncbi:amino acid ABC transporter substrate-binding protein [Nitrospirillum iridis]|uniref:General L-amino acid transport system substrate-binding protein n=1 Tax=Nitrospirillum iridis TaxID=765888 RepID=A0A7X0AYT8_9PROT|nr:amino acid ABC transporter substrate-binding protein [Nitrospirillum iridis]MBB6252634.1 general L-amino acid transport system substrate-binding protein [Nitrospirillum iridis]
MAATRPQATVLGIVLAMGLALAAQVASAAPPTPGPSTLDQVRQRGILRCGVNTGLPGFGAPDSQGDWTGLDVDVCRAVAAAVVGDARKVEFIPLSGRQRFSSLLSGEIDLLSRNTTWTLTRDAQGMEFAPPVYYDGQGFMVRRAFKARSVRDLDGATICVQQGTTTELNLADYFRSVGMSYKPLAVEDLRELVEAFFAGRCDAYTTDASALAATRAAQTVSADDYLILPELISKEPLAPAVRKGDGQWFDIVKWTVFALIEAEERGVTQANVRDNLASSAPGVQRLLGVGAGVGLGKSLGLDDQWAVRVISQVGNYGEVFERNVGRNSVLRLDRGLNALWNRGGLMYAMPIR